MSASKPEKEMPRQTARHAEKTAAFEPFAQRLKDKGKALKKVRIAVARKLLIVLNTMIANGRPFYA